MDSANSGSIQSSSGGDEEYDSRADSISALFHPPSSSSSAAAGSLPAPPFSSSHPSTYFFNSLAFLDHSPLLPIASSSPCPPRPFRPSPTPTPDFPSFPPPSSSSSSHPRGPQIAQSSVQQLPDNPIPTAAPPRSSKKRSRASRRAPTTVLTTDTSNFRAMVQEFTGIPSPPFSAAASSTLSPFSRSRLDLFHSSASPASSLPPPYLRLRPFAQKPPSFPSLNPSSSTGTAAIIDALASVCNPISSANATGDTPITTASTCTASNSTPNNNNHQLPPPDFGFGSQSQTLFNFQSQGPVINFQSLLTHKDTLPTMPAFATRPQAVIPSADFASGELGLPPGFIGSEGMHSVWARASGPDGGEQAQVRPVVGGNYNGAQQRVSCCKLNCSAPGSTELNAEKGSEGVAARGEAMVDSWICSSD